MALPNQLFILVFVLVIVEPSSQYALLPAQVFQTTLMFENYGSNLKKIYGALSEGVDFDELWKDMKKDPGPYGSSALSTTAMGMYYGFRRGGVLPTAVGAVTGAAIGIYSQYVVAHNIKKEPERAKTSAKLYRFHKQPIVNNRP